MVADLYPRQRPGGDSDGRNAIGDMRRRADASWKEKRES